ncbi:MAG: DUF177 domain-containing protein [Flavobacteriales bacterium]|nr:DUF177 domain-containing protein [Flavobacteriales bacterium]
MPKNCIRIAGLSEGEHGQEFEIRNKFFQKYKESEVKTGEFIVKIVVVLRGLDRKLTINIEGKITNLLCDYCAKKLNCVISTTSNFVIKENEEEIESTDEIIYVLPNQHHLDLSQLIFEMVNLSIPNKRTHSKSEQEKGECDKGMLQLMEKYATKTNKEIDPRWEVLNKLKVK